MSVVHVVVTFQTRPESAAAFAALLAQVKRDLPQVAGCRAVRVFADDADPCAFTLLETWASADAHAAHFARIVASGDWAAVTSHLDAAPTSRRCVEIE